MMEMPMAALKPSWSKPSSILFASECPPNEKIFGFALAQAAEFGAHLTIFHVYDSSGAGAFQASKDRCYYDSEERAEKHIFEPLVERARNLHIPSKIVFQPGSPANEILNFLSGHKVDRVVMGAHSPGPVGKLLVGSVAEALLRKANVPVCIVGPNVGEGTYRNLVTRKVLCDVSNQKASRVVARFGAGLAVEHNASLVLHHVIPPQERAETLGDRTPDQIEAELPSLVPDKLKHRVRVRTRVALGDPAEELLLHGRTQQADLIVLGAHGASKFAAIARSGMVYKVVAYAHCPVIALSPIVLAECGARDDRPRAREVNYMAGVI
jgi:nucleotide-binding universal stress UspA family protein